MYTIAAILGDVLVPYCKEILEVLNHCRYDKMKPVREAAIEAINLIKEIDPPVTEELQTNDNNLRKEKSSKNIPEKPWKKRKSQVKAKDNSRISNPNFEEDDDEPERKISNATKKRLEAQEAKKKIQPSKSPNLNKEKKSIFARKKNPNFFTEPKKPSEPEIKILSKNVDSEKEERHQNSNSKKSHNFYFQKGENNMDDTPEFNDSEEKKSEEEKRMNLSNDPSDEKTDLKKKPVMPSHTNNGNEDNVAVHVPPQNKIGSVQQRKAQNIQQTVKTEIYFKQRKDDESSEKVEETPEDKNMKKSLKCQEQQVVDNFNTETSNLRQNKTWDRTRGNENQQKQTDISEQEQVYNTIAERIRERNMLNKQEYESLSVKNNQQMKFETNPSYEKPRDIQRMASAGQNPSLQQNPIVSNIQEFKQDFSKFESNVDDMMRQNPQPYSENMKSGVTRHTISAPSASNFGFDVKPRQEQRFSTYNQSNAQSNAFLNYRNPQLSGQKNEASFESKSVSTLIAFGVGQYSVRLYCGPVSYQY